MRVIDSDKLLKQLETLNITREIKWFSYKELIKLIKDCSFESTKMLNKPSHN